MSTLRTLLSTILILCIGSFAIAQDNEFHLDETYSIDRNGTLILSSDDAEVFIIGSDRSNVHVKIDRVIESKGLRWGDRHFKVEVSEENGNLRIEDKQWGNQTGFVGYSMEEYVIRIETPRTVNLAVCGIAGGGQVLASVGV